MVTKETVEHFCGNCDSHNCYDYPTKIFCSTKHWHNEDPIMDTLGCCGNWNQVSQECHCVREAKKAKPKR